MVARYVDDGSLPELRKSARTRTYRELELHAGDKRPEVPIPIHNASHSDSINISPVHVFLLLSSSLILAASLSLSLSLSHLIGSVYMDEFSQFHAP